MRKQLLNHIVFLAELDERVWLLTADLGHGVLDEFASKYPDRFINVGVAEQCLMGVAAGLAREGKIPFVYSMSNFVTMRCLEQIRNDISYPMLPVRIISVGGGYTYGAAGYSHHGIEDISAIRSMPYIEISLPTTDEDAFQVLHNSLYSNHPIYIRVPRELNTLVDNPEEYDITVVSYGDGYPVARELAASLGEQGLVPRLLTAKRLRPFYLRELYDEKKPIVFVEEHSEFGGLASEFLDLMSSNGARCLVFGLSPQHTGGTCEEMTGDMFNLEEMTEVTKRWYDTYDNGR